MQHSIKMFDFNSNQVRVVVNEKNEPLFCASDVTKILGYSNGRQAIDFNCEKDGVYKLDITDSLGRSQSATFITEGNLYRLIGRSTKPEAKQFDKFVYDDVLVSIRKHGAYMTPEAIEKTIMNPDFIINLANELKRERAEKEKLAVENRAIYNQLNAVAPKAEYYDKVLQSNTGIPITKIAKELGMSASALNKILHATGVQYMIRGTWVLYGEHQNKGYVKTETFDYVDHKGEVCTAMHTYWTEKGREFIINKVRKIGKHEVNMHKQDAEEELKNA